MKLRSTVTTTEHTFINNFGYECGSILVHEDGSYQVFRLTVTGSMDSAIRSTPITHQPGPLRDPLKVMKFWLWNSFEKHEPETL